MDFVEKRKNGKFERWLVAVAVAMTGGGGGDGNKNNANNNNNNKNDEFCWWGARIQSVYLYSNRFGV